MKQTLGSAGSSIIRILGLTAALATAAGQLGSAQGQPQVPRTTNPCRASHRTEAGCRTFWLTEAAYGARVAGGVKDPFSPSNPHFGATVDVGGLVNLGGPLALGGTASVALQGDLYFALKPRARFWVSPVMSVDVSAGPAFSGPPTFVAEASIMYRDRIGFAVQAMPLESVLYDPVTTQTSLIRKTALYAGLKLGSRPGLFGILADGAAVAVTIGAFIIACSGNRCFD